MPPKKNRRAATPSMAPARVMTFLALPVAAVGWVFGLPGITAMWALLVAASFMTPAPELTGKKDSLGQPTPGTPGEQRRLRSYRLAADLRFRLTTPNVDWLPGWSIADMMAAIGSLPGSLRTPRTAATAVVSPILLAWCAATATAVTIAGVNSYRSGWFTAFDATAVYVIVCAKAGVARRAKNDFEPSPGLRLGNLPTDRAGLVRLGVGAVAGIAVFALTHRAFSDALVSYVNPDPLLQRDNYVAVVWAIFCVLAFAGIVVGRRWRHSALDDWLHLVKMRAEWENRFESIKVAPAPMLRRLSTVGPYTIETFTAPANNPASAFYSMGPRIAPMVGVNVGVCITSVPATDADGQDIIGTRHPLDFQIITWDLAETADLNLASTPTDVARLAVEIALHAAADSLGCSRVMLDELLPVAAAGDAQAWLATLIRPDGPDLPYIRDALSDEIAAAAGCDVLIDTRWNGVGLLYLGDLGGNVDYASADESLHADANAAKVTALATELRWNTRWRDTLKQGANLPRAIADATLEADLLGGQTIYRQGFAIVQGVSPDEYFGTADKLKSTLDSAPFVSVTGWQRPHGQPGERHPQAFAVTWSDRPVPASPAQLPPGGDPKASMWVLGGMVDEAFRAARLAKPETYRVTELTTDTPHRRGPGRHIWRIDVRLFGGVTLADVRGAMNRLRQGLATEWLRVAGNQDGTVAIFAGADPAGPGVEFTHPDRARAQIESLNWEQAWMAAKVTSNGLTPTLVSVEPVEKNPKVLCLDFDLPEGIDLPAVKAAAKKLEVNSNNAFIDVRRHPSGEATKIRVMASRTDPMPELARFNFDEQDTDDHRIGIATGLTGEPVMFDNKTDPMLLVSGSPGSGKSVALQNLLFGAAIRGWSLFIADPAKGAVDFNFATDWARGIAVDLWQTKALMDDIYALVVARKAINKAHSCGNYRDLPDDVRYNHVMVMIDEFTSLILPEPVPAGSDDPAVMAEVELVKAKNGARAYIGTMLGRIVREARSTGFTVVIATQALKADTLAKVPGGNDLRDNMSRCIVGTATFGQLMAALKMPTEAPPMPDSMPRGRGLYEGNGRKAEFVQFWFEPSQTAFAERIAEHRQPLAEADKLDLSAATAPEPDLEGGIIARTPAPAAADEVVDLGEMSLDDLGIDLSDLDLGLDLDEGPDADGALDEPARPKPDQSEPVVPDATQKADTDGDDLSFLEDPTPVVATPHPSPATGVDDDFWADFDE